MIHSFPFYIADWRDSKARMRMNRMERCLYLELLVYCWGDGSLPSDVETLLAISGFSHREFVAAWPKVEHEFILVDGKYRHHKVDAERPRLENWREARKRGAEEANRRRAAKAKASAEADAIAPLDRTPPSSSSSSSSSSSPGGGSEALSVNGGTPPTPATNEKFPDDADARIRQIADSYPTNDGYEEGCRTLLQRLQSDVHPLRTLATFEANAPLWIAEIVAGNSPRKSWYFFVQNSNWLKPPKIPVARSGRRDPMDGVTEKLRERGYK